MHHDSYRFTVDDGQPLHVYRWLPASAPRGALLAVHGISEHAARYDALAQRLTAAGYAVYAHDQRGHGRTAAEHPELGFVAARHGWQRLLADIQALNRHLGEAHPGLPRVLYGHSMGSLLGQEAAIEHGDSWDALVLQASNHRPDLLPVLGAAAAQLLAVLFGPRHRSRALDFLTIGVLRYRLRSRRTYYDWLNRDPAEVDAYISDSRCGFSPAVSLWRDVYAASRRIADPRRQARLPPQLPVLLLVGAADGLSDGGLRVRRLAECYRKQGMQSVALRVYPGARHELHREINREEVFADLAAWLDQHCTLAEPSSSVHLTST